MSKGTPRYVFRLDHCQKMFVDATIARRNLWARGEPWTLSDFIRVAIWEKIRKMERSRKRKRKAGSEKMTSANGSLPMDANIETMGPVEYFETLDRQIEELLNAPDAKD